MTINIAGFKEVLDILQSLFSGLKKAVDIPAENRKELKEAIADTAELIDETLTILKVHLTNVAKELKFGDKFTAKRMIYELGSFPEWEQRYRQFQLCDSLRMATDNLERKGLYKFLNNISYSDIDKVHQRMWDYIGGETNAANSVGTMLQDLATLESKVDSEPDKVILSLEEARNEIGKWRQIFIDFEKEIRDSM
ncbi:MAG: hypothetical protein RO257_02000 [Candidatus Kapabacteria bacterium]|jgi:hypothetical protein|nr:hypothetical protein [Candidatus Kapabacteria bacterium]